MKIVHINTTDQGGAAVAALRLHNGLLQMNVDSNFLVLNRKGLDNSKVFTFSSDLKTKLKKLVFKTRLYKSPIRDIYHLLHSNREQYEQLSFPKSLYDLVVNPLVRQADIVHLHWVAGFLDYPSFFMAIDKPLVWTLHDMNPFSGIFHYDFDIPKGSRDILRLDDHARRIKMKAFEHVDPNKLKVICPSLWLKDEASSSDLMRKYNIGHIPYGLPTEVFFSEEKKKARRKLGIDQNKPTMLFVSDSISIRRKGFDLIRDVLPKFSDVNFIAVGEGGANRTDKNVQYFGRVSDLSVLRSLFSVADAFILPSRQDNLPNTMLESMACGTPVIGSNVGGMSDMIKHGENGLLFEAGSRLDLTEKLRQFINLPEESRLQMGKEAENKIKRNHKLGDQAATYIELYESLL